MPPSDLAPCVAVVPGTPVPDAVTQLPTTGADVSGLPWLVVAAGVIVVVGVLLVAGARGRRGAGSVSALVAIAVVVGIAAGTGPASSSQAAVPVGASGQQCSLFTLSDVQRGDPHEASALLPGESADVLTLSVTNATAAPIELRASLAPTGGDASVFVAEITTDAGVNAAGVLSHAPGTTPIAVAPGERLDVRVRVGLPLDADHAGAASTFDTILTATGG